MTFRFVHTADWQLGKPFGQFGEELSANLRRARHDAIGRVARAARDAGAGHVVVAGDVWDVDQPSGRELRQPVGAMAAASDLTWWLLPGNHDPAGRGSLWDRLREGAGLPANVRCLCTAKPYEAAPGVYLLPAPLLSRDPGRDPTVPIGAMPTPDGAIRIGVAHGSVRRFGSDEARGVIDPGRAESAGLAYLALGDWHGHKRVGARTWYAGTPEPDQFPPNNEPGYVLSVVANGGLPEVTPVLTRRYHWAKHEVALSPDDDPVAAFEACYEGEDERACRLSRLAFTGALPIEARGALVAHLDAQREDSFAYLAYDLSALGVAEATPRGAFSEEGTLRVAAEALMHKAEHAEGEAGRRAARRAYELLHRFAA